MLVLPWLVIALAPFPRGEDWAGQRMHAAIEAVVLVHESCARSCDPNGLMNQTVNLLGQNTSFKVMSTLLKDRHGIVVTVSAMVTLFWIGSVSPSSQGRGEVINITSGMIQTKGTGNKDKGYLAGEVDKEAEIRDEDKVFKGFQKEFRCEEGRVKLTLLLHKSGKVTDVETDTTPNCNVSEKGRMILQRLKFTPAIKNGAKVSEYVTIEIKRETLIDAPISNVPNVPYP